jgi:copper chaperone CopZ
VTRRHPTYLHALEGRLRVKLEGVKGSPVRAAEVVRELQVLEGVEEVTANPKTGNALILYDSSRIQQQQILDALWAGGFLEMAGHAEASSQPGLSIASDTLTRMFVRSSVEFALQRVLTALI